MVDRVPANETRPVDPPAENAPAIAKGLGIGILAATLNVSAAFYQATHADRSTVTVSKDPIGQPQTPLPEKQAERR